MDIEASIIDQQLTGLINKHADLLPKTDLTKQRATAFVLLCMQHYLAISIAEARDLLTDAGIDTGIDGLHMSDVEDCEFTVTIFMCKYNMNNFNGTTNFPENRVKSAITVVQALFDPSKKIEMNANLRTKVAEIHSLIQDTYIPNIRVVLCNNGLRWNNTSDILINDIENIYRDKVTFEYFNHKSIINILKRQSTVDAHIQLSGKIIVEDMNYMRVLIGRVSVHIIAKLMEEFGDNLLQRNLRRYLGLHNNRVNFSIDNILCSEQSDKFYFYNNGITLVCDKFDYNAFQTSDYNVSLKNMQIINGVQTCKTIHETLKVNSKETFAQDAYVMIRIYQLDNESLDFVQDITYAINSKNYIDIRALHSNDDLQKKLEIGISHLGYIYKRKREDTASSAQIITRSIVAETTLAIWREKPHQAKFRRKEHFGKLYEEIFTDLTPAQAILAVLIFRDVENKRKSLSQEHQNSFIPYASHYLAMLVGKNLLRAKGIALQDILDTNFIEIEKFYQKHCATLYEESCNQVKKALEACYGMREISSLQLAATFRRGDLLEMLA